MDSERRRKCLRMTSQGCLRRRGGIKDAAMEIHSRGFRCRNLSPFVLMIDFRPALFSVCHFSQCSSFSLSLCLSLSPPPPPPTHPHPLRAGWYGTSLLVHTVHKSACLSILRAARAPSTDRRRPQITVGLLWVTLRSTYINSSVRKGRMQAGRGGREGRGEQPCNWIFTV